jgi:uncharacterized membrane protein
MKSERKKWYKAKKKSDDVLSSIINLTYVLGIDVEISYIRKILNAHPDYPSLLTVSHVLMEMDIENETLEGTIDELSSDDYPGLALMKNQSLIVLKKIDFEARCMHCIDSTVGHKIFSFETFETLWSGIVIRTALPNSSEILHSKASRGRIISEKILHFPFSAAISIFLLGIFFSIPAFESLGYSKSIFFLGILKLTGLILSLFLFWGSSKGSFFFQKICSTRGIFDCKKVIQSPAGKLFGMSLIEWGIIYFSCGILLLFLGIHSEDITVYKNLISLMTITAMTYSVYLLIYQFAYMKKMCLLCLVIQICIWTEFFILLKSIDFSFRWISGYFVTLFILCLLTIFLTWRAVRYCIYMSWKLEKKEIELLKTRRNPEYVNFILSKSKKFDIGRFPNEIEYGGDEAIVNIIFVMHPFCKPCHNTFSQLNKLVRQGRGKVQGVIRIITGTKELDGLDVEVAKIVFYYLVAHGARASIEVLSDWLYMENNSNEYGKKRLKWLQNRYPCINNDLIVEADNIVNAHREWGASIPIVTTPVIFLNDIQLPQNFQISDLTYYLFYNM